MGIVAASYQVIGASEIAVKGKMVSLAHKLTEVVRGVLGVCSTATATDCGSDVQLLIVWSNQKTVVPACCGLSQSVVVRVLPVSITWLFVVPGLALYQTICEPSAIRLGIVCPTHRLMSVADGGGGTSFT